eukprot:1579339-Karenia_brevis.AAC.1
MMRLHHCALLHPYSMMCLRPPTALHHQYSLMRLQKKGSLKAVRHQYIMMLLRHRALLHQYSLMRFRLPTPFLCQCS